MKNVNDWSSTVRSINGVAYLHTFLLLSAAAAAVFLVDDVVVVCVEGFAAAAAAVDGGRPTERPVVDGLAACFPTAATRGFSVARVFSAAGGFLVTCGFAAAILVRSFFGETGGTASMSLAGCDDD